MQDNTSNNTEGIFIHTNGFDERLILACVACRLYETDGYVDVDAAAKAMRGVGNNFSKYQKKLYEVKKIYPVVANSEVDYKESNTVIRYVTQEDKVVDVKNMIHMARALENDINNTRFKNEVGQKEWQCGKIKEWLNDFTDIHFKVSDVDRKILEECEKELIGAFNYINNMMNPHSVA